MSRPASLARPALFALLLAAAALALLQDAPRASAHALLARADPPINAALRESPTAITLFMTEPLQREYSSVQVLDSGGQRRDIGATEFFELDATRMRVNVLRLTPGVYTVVWRTLSQIDGHTWNGSYVFSVLNPDGSAPAGAGVVVELGRSGPPTAADAAVKAVGFAALFLFVGALAFWLAAGALPEARGGLVESTVRPMLAIAAALGILTTGYEAVAAALELGGFGLLDDILFNTRLGLWLHTRWFALIAAALLLTWLARRPRAAAPEWARRSLAAPAIAWLASTAAVSHGAALAAGGIWGALFDALHLTAAALWIGMLAALIAALWRGRRDAGPQRRPSRTLRIALVQRFSLIAAASVPVLLAAGLLGALIQIPDARGLVETDWGAAFIAKLVALLLLFSAAALNAILLRPRSAQGDARAERWFAPMMRIELALAAVVLVITAALTQLPSPVSALPDTEQRDNTITRTVARADVLAQITIAPNLVGFNRWEVRLTDAAGAPLDNPVEAVRLRFRYDDPSVGPVAAPTIAEGDGVFSLEGAYFGLPGRWTVEAELRRASGDDLLAAVQSEVVPGYQTVLPWETGAPGALALPLTQMDWNGVGALWAFVIGGLLLANRRHVRDRFGVRAGDASLAGGGLGVIAAVVLLTGLHVDPGRTLQNPVERTPASVERGELLFAASCASCHGEAGAGDGPLADTLPAPPANFTVHVPYHPDGVLFAWISDGIRGTGMPAWRNQLSEQERWDLVNFLRAHFDPISAASR